MSIITAYKIRCRKARRLVNFPLRFKHLSNSAVYPHFSDTYSTPDYKPLIPSIKPMNFIIQNSVRCTFCNRFDTKSLIFQSFFVRMHFVIV